MLKPTTCISSSALLSQYLVLWNLNLLPCCLQIVSHWSRTRLALIIDKHFSQLLIWTPSVKQSALDQIPQKPALEELNNPPSLNEVRNVIKQGSCSKAAGKDGIPAELLKALSEDSLNTFHEVLASIWEEEEMPSDLHDAMISNLYKNKGTGADSRNYKGIWLLSVACKILALSSWIGWYQQSQRKASLVPSVGSGLTEVPLTWSSL